MAALAEKVYPTTNLYPLSTVHDPLKVLASTAPVVDAARFVRIDDAVIARLAGELADSPPPIWDETLHWRDGSWRTAVWVLVLDALNFCFWSASSDPRARWRVAWRGEEHDGYDALAAALHRAVDDGRPLWDAAYLAAISDDEVADILQPLPGATAIPLFPARAAHVREVGRGLLALGDEAAVAGAPVECGIEWLMARAGGSATRLILEVVRRFPSFDDTLSAPGWLRSERNVPAAASPDPIRFYKRAQILVADLHGAFAGEGLGAFDDLDTLTAFADYKVPQVLRHLGVLIYAPALATRIERREPIPAGAREEVEIRAATVWACERLRRALAARGRQIAAYEVDWLLWTAGQRLPAATAPYHRTLTVFY